jgi:hypothetical protein
MKKLLCIQVARVASRLARAPAWSKLVAALALGVAIGYGPVVGQSQPPPHAGPPLANLPAAAQNALGGNSIALARVVKHDNPANPIATWGRGANPTNSLTVEPDASEVDFTIKSDGNSVYITGELVEDYLRDLGQAVGEQPGAPVEVVGVSVVLKVGTSTTYCDCYYVNGKRKCDCIKL